MMSARRSRRKPAGKKPVTGSSQSRKSGRRPHWPLTWVGSLISAAVVTAVTATVTVIVTQLTQSAMSGEDAHPGPPVLFDSVQNLHAANDYSFPEGVKFTARRISDINTQLSSGNYGQWMTSNGGVGVELSTVQLIVSGNAKGGARITNITAEKSCRQPLSGTLFSANTQGSQASVSIGLNLDKPTPAAQNSSGQDFFSMNTIELALNEQQVIDVTAITHRFYCSYQLMLTVLANGKSVTEPVPAAGNGRVTAYAARYSSIYQQGSPSSPDSGFSPVNPETWATPEAGHHG